MRNLSQPNHRVNADHFTMQERADIPRSTFRISHTHKTTLDGNFLYPWFVDEALPGDSLHGKVTIFARISTLLFPLMDHVELETFYFFVPNRLVWANWVKFMGQRNNPGDSISYTVPQVGSTGNGFAQQSMFDYMGLPVVGNVAPIPTGVCFANAMPARAYNLIFNEWFRDEDLRTSLTVTTTDGPDAEASYALMTRSKRKDYFTSARPWPAKETTANGTIIPMIGQLPVAGLGVLPATASIPGPVTVKDATGFGAVYPQIFNSAATSYYIRATQTGTPANDIPVVNVSLAGASAFGAGPTVELIRAAMQTQRFLERDSRNGTRYTELLRSHFGVTPEDFRLQRPEYIGGGKSALNTQAIPQTAPAAGGSTPLANLGAAGTITGQHEWRYNAKEHGHIIGILTINPEVTYQNNLRRMWTRQTRYDYYWPVFAHLGEQAIRTDELWFSGAPAVDTQTFGYQERWAEYKWHPSYVSGKFRSNVTGSLDTWHLAQNFVLQPLLNVTFTNNNAPYNRVLAAGSLSAGQQFLVDSLHELTYTRPMPMYSTPGMLDHF